MTTRAVSLFNYLIVTQHSLTRFVVIGYPYHDGENQKWIFAQSQGAWTIKSAEMDLYIAPSTTSPTNYTALQASSTPFLWDIWHDEVNNNAYR